MSPLGKWERLEERGSKQTGPDLCCLLEENYQQQLGRAHSIYYYLTKYLVTLFPPFLPLNGFGEGHAPEILLPKCSQGASGLLPVPEHQLGYCGQKIWPVCPRSCHPLPSGCHVHTWAVKPSCRLLCSLLPCYPGPRLPGRISPSQFAPSPVTGPSLFS